MKKLTVYSDGGCEPNPGPGGWAAVLSYGKHTREISGGEPATTNNRMEIQAAIAALRALKEACEIDFFTDSIYVRDGITKWVAQWKAKGWKLTTKKPVKNADLWRQLDAEAARHQIRWHWVRGHAGNAGNERCDELALVQIANIKRRYSPAQLQALISQFIASRSSEGTEDQLFGDEPGSLKRR